MGEEQGVGESSFSRARGALPAPGAAVWWFLRRGRSLAVVRHGNVLAIPDGFYGAAGSLGVPDAAEPLLVGYRDGQACLAVSVPDAMAMSEGLEWRDLFRLFG